jgi:hypothetical protein
MIKIQIHGTTIIQYPRVLPIDRLKIVQGINIEEPLPLLPLLLFKDGSDGSVVPGGDVVEG